MKQQPFFVIGAPRSGTTMLQLSLARHTRVVMPPETHFFTLVHRSRRGQKRHWERIERGLQVRVDRPACRIRPGPLARLYFSKFAEAYIDKVNSPNASHFGEKSPEHQLRIPSITKSFPDAKFILIYRDGRDVARSLCKVSWMPNNLYVNFSIWLHYFHIQRRFLQREPHRVICVCYEDLVRNPQRELSTIIEFLGLDYEPAMAEGSGDCGIVRHDELPHKSRALEPISTGRIGTWRRELTHREIARLERWGGWALRELHYECVTKCQRFLPPWHFPNLYGRLAFEAAIRMVKRKTDDLFGTCFYWPNRHSNNQWVSRSAANEPLSDVPSCIEQH